MMYPEGTDYQSIDGRYFFCTMCPMWYIVYIVLVFIHLYTFVLCNSTTLTVTALFNVDTSEETN